MAQAYLFVHFKEKRTPDGEQVYFGISTDGYHWETVNDGNPVLWSYEGDRGVRDFTITRTENGKFIILATDLSLAYGFNYKYKKDWGVISTQGSKCLVMWQSDDLIHWSDQKMLKLGDDNFGCLWAPDIIYDTKNEDYIIHWSSTHKAHGYHPMRIYYSRTKDFETFTAPKELYKKEDSGIIDSAMYEENGKYYLFVKSDRNPARIILLESDTVTGPFTKIPKFDESMSVLQEGLYEAPTACRTEDGKWCLFLDFYGTDATGQGYIPFLADTLSSGDFKRSDASFHFPYGYKHGTILPISMEEYERLKAYKKSPNEH